MFSFFSKKADPQADELVGLLAPLLVAARSSGIPLKKLAADPFVAGYVAGNITAFLKTTQLPRLRLGQLLIDVNGRFGTDLMKGANRISKHEPLPPDYVQGLQAGMKVAHFSRGTHNFDSDPDLERAIESANMLYTAHHLATTGEAVPLREAGNDEIRAALVEHLFLEPLQHRFNFTVS
jgi:hypothetical protein